MGRATQGVTLISLDEGEKLAGLEKVAALKRACPGSSGFRLSS